MKNCLFILLLSVHAIFGQVKFEAETKSGTVALNQRFRIDFTVDANGEDFLAPDFEGFKVVAGPYTKHSSTYKDDVQTVSNSYTYFLTALKPGEFVIGPASMKVDGKRYTTLPVKMTVTNEVAKKEDSEPMKLFDKK